MSVKVDIKQLLESGVHFGHKTSRWHPTMAPYIHSKRQDSHIIDLTKTVEGLEKALPEITKVVSANKKVLFVGTKKQVKDITREAAESVNQPFVTERWVGGMLTNSSTVNQQIKKLKNLEKRMSTGELEKRYSKLEVQRYAEEIEEMNVKYGGIKDLMGISAVATVRVKGTKLEASGPTLITHWGMSGPGILRLSAWGANLLATKNYQFTIQVNWLNDATFEETFETLKELKTVHSKKIISKKSPFDFPNRLWESLVQASGIGTFSTSNDSQDVKWGDVSNKQLMALAVQLTNGEFQVNGKSTFKEEFVTAGGIDLKEINFKTMESKLLPNLYFAGEIVNIDAITGGFNFQNAWTSGFILASEIFKK